MQAVSMMDGHRYNPWVPTSCRAFEVACIHSRISEAVSMMDGHRYNPWLEFIMDIAKVLGCLFNVGHVVACIHSRISEAELMLMKY